MPAEFEFHQRNRDIHPPAFTPDYKTSVLRSPRIPLWSLQNSLSEVTGPRFHAERAWRARSRPPAELRQGRRADWRTHHRARPRAGREWPAGAGHAGRDLAGQCRRPLPSPQRHLSRPDRSELRRLRPGADRRTRLLRIPYRQAGRLSVPQSGELLAARPHSLLVVRHQDLRSASLPRCISRATR